MEVDGELENEMREKVSARKAELLQGTRLLRDCA